MDPDVALCISGQMRTYKKCYGYLRENIIEPLNPDIFIDTWKKPGGTTKAGGITSDQTPVTEKTLRRLYSPESFKIEPFKNEYFTEKDGVSVPTRLQEHTKHWKGNIPMFYKMKGCNNMKSDYEEENGFTYDLVLKIRPDLVVREEIPKEVLRNPNILWHSECMINDGVQVSDKFAISSSENMDYYTSVWENLNEYWENPLGDGEWKDVRVGERLMRHHMAQSSIEVQSFSSGCDVLRTRDYAIEQNTTTIGNALTRLLKRIR